jgi:hypothetical protein
MIKQACQCDGSALFRRLGFVWAADLKVEVKRTITDFGSTTEVEPASCFVSVILSRGTDSPELEGWALVPGFGHFCPACATVLHALVDKLRPLFDALPPLAPPSAVSWDDQDGTKCGLGPGHGGAYFEAAGGKR